MSYEQLLTQFWRSIDAATRDRQFCDAGSPCRSAIVAPDAAQRPAVRQGLDDLEKTRPFNAPMLTQIVMAGPFCRAEEYHQDYHLMNPVRDQYHRHACGRDARLEPLWGGQAAVK